MIRYLDMFAGIGGFRAGLTRAGGFQCVGHCEIDKYADKSYRAIHEPTKEECYYPDARTLDPATLPDFDLLCGGFPCQSFSNAGKRKGFDDARGTLFFELARLAEARRPSYLLFENVPGLLSHDQGRTFTTILTTLHGLGYGLEWMVLNSKDFGPPQSRRRVYIVGYLDPRCAGKILPVPSTGGAPLVQILGGSQGSRVYDARGVARTLTAQSGGISGKTGLYFVDENNPQKDVLYIKEATKKGYKAAFPGDSVNLAYATSNTRRGRVGHEIAHTLETSCAQGVVLRSGRIRRLMPRECLRLQGFAEDQIDRLLAVTSDAQAYKQAGNSVTVDVIEAIGKNLRAVDDEIRGVAK
jgi:DNA (cytosine-5)-methyltransferase 1